MKKWRQLAEETSAVDQQTEEIHQTFRMDKINKEFSQLSATAEEEQEEEQEGPDYTMDEFDRINPFGDEFKPDVLTPPPSPEPTPGPSTVSLKEQSQPSLGPSPETLKEPPPPYHAFDDYPGETDEKIKNRLSFVKREITKIKNDPNYKK